MDIATLAAQLADRLMKSKDQQELKYVSAQVARYSDDLKEYLPWLRDIWSSANWCIKHPGKPNKEFLNKEGLKWLSTNL